VFDIGGPEFLVIAIVALVVLGPERLPEVMRRAGQLYRQVREMASQYTSEAQRMLEEGMREVQDVSDTFNQALQDGTAESDANQPPPPLAQVPPLLLPPETAAVAGPWILPAWYRDSSADVEPHSPVYVEGPTALARPLAEEPLVDAAVGGPSLMGPAPEPEDLPPLDEEPLPPALPQVPASVDNVRSATAAAPAPASHPTEPRPPSRNGKTAHAIAGATVPEDTVQSTRERTLIELCRAGSVSLEKGAEFLGISPEEFLAKIERATQQATPS
jgi:sec-independent protein translocase protein TatB